MVAGDGDDIPLPPPVEADPHLRTGADVEGRRGCGERLVVTGPDQGKRSSPFLLRDLLPDRPAVNLREPRPQVRIGRNEPQRCPPHGPGVDFAVEAEDDMHRRVVDALEVDIEDVEGGGGMAGRRGRHYHNIALIVDNCFRAIPC